MVLEFLGFSNIGFFMFLVWTVIALTGGFLGGTLFARNSPQHSKKILDEVDDVAEGTEAWIKKEVAKVDEMISRSKK